MKTLTKLMAAAALAVGGSALINTTYAGPARSAIEFAAPSGAAGGGAGAPGGAGTPSGAAAPNGGNAGAPAGGNSGSNAGVPNNGNNPNPGNSPTQTGNANGTNRRFVAAAFG